MRLRERERENEEKERRKQLLFFSLPLFSTLFCVQNNSQTTWSSKYCLLLHQFRPRAASILRKRQGKLGQKCGEEWKKNFLVYDVPKKSFSLFSGKNEFLGCEFWRERGEGEEKKMRILQVNHLLLPPVCHNLYLMHNMIQIRFWQFFLLLRQQRPPRKKGRRERELKEQDWHANFSQAKKGRKRHLFPHEINNKKKVSECDWET